MWFLKKSYRMRNQHHNCMPLTSFLPDPTGTGLGARIPGAGAPVESSQHLLWGGRCLWSDLGIWELQVGVNAAGQWGQECEGSCCWVMTRLRVLKDVSSSLWWTDCTQCLCSCHCVFPSPWVWVGLGGWLVTNRTQQARWPDVTSLIVLWLFYAVFFFF